MCELGAVLAMGTGYAVKDSAASRCGTRERMAELRKEYLQGNFLR